MPAPLAIPPPDPWGRYLPKQAQPPRDWSKAPWADVASEAAKQVVPTYARDLWQSVSGLPNLYGQLSNEVAKGVGLYTDPISDVIKAATAPTGTPTPRLPAGSFVPPPLRPSVISSVGQNFANVGRAENDYAYNRYTGPGALKNTLATDPGGALMDAQAVASIPEGAEGVLGRVPGVAGDVLRPVAATARTFNHITNPVTLGGAALAKGATAARTAIRGGPVLDKAGAFTPAVTAAVTKAFPNGEIGPAEMAHPGFRPQLASTLQAKGITPAAVKQAVLAYHGAPTAQATLTRSRPAQSMAETVADANASGKAAVTDKLQSVVGGAPDPATLGAAVGQAHDQSLAAAGQNYTDLKAIPGSFGPSLNGPDLNAHISARLGVLGMPNTPELLERSSRSYPEANSALGMVNDALVNGNTRLGGDVTMPEVAETRRQLTQYQNAAKGSDKAAVNAIINGLHDHLESTSAAGQFVGPNGPVDISGKLKDANAAYAQHFNTFDNSQGPARAIKSTVASLEGSGDAGLVGPDAQAAAAKGLVTNLASPTQGPATYGVLKNALGSQSGALDDYMRKAAVLAPDGSVLPSGKIRGNLDGPAGSLFAPDEVSEIRLGAAAQDVLNAKPAPGSVAPKDMSSLARRAIGAGVGYGAGLAVAPLLPHFPEPIINGLGAVGGAVSEGLIEPYFQARNAAKQLSGAPSAGDFLNGPASVGRFAQTSAGPAIPIAHAIDNLELDNGGAGAAGGSAGVQVPPPSYIASSPDIDLSTVPGPYDTNSAAPAAAPPPTNGVDPWAQYVPTNATQGSAPQGDLSTVPGPYDDAPARATGGRVSAAEIDRLVARLEARAKQAKADTKKATKPLLNVPDAAIAKALAVAQGAI